MALSKAIKLHGIAGIVLGVLLLWPVFSPKADAAEPDLVKLTPEQVFEMCPPVGIASFKITGDLEKALHTFWFCWNRSSGWLGKVNRHITHDQRFLFKLADEF